MESRRARGVRHLPPSALHLWLMIELLLGERSLENESYGFAMGLGGYVIRCFVALKSEIITEMVLHQIKKGLSVEITWSVTLGSG